LCALVDLGWLRDGWCTLLIFLTGIITFFSLWIYVIVTSGEGELFELLYLGSVGIGCGSWLALQLVNILVNHNLKGVQYFVLAGISGGIPLAILFDNNVSIWLCEEINCHFSPEFLWFVATDIAIYCIYKYYLASHTSCS